ncbi:MAG: hypothetical protein ABIP85_13905 [Chthoniobacteraceae bacterium]
MKQFKQKAETYAKELWPDSALESELAEALVTYHSCITQGREKGRPSLIWTSKMLRSVGVTVDNPATLLLIAHELMETFLGFMEIMQSALLV